MASIEIKNQLGTISNYDLDLKSLIELKAYLIPADNLII